MPTAASATSSIRYDGETYELAEPIDLGSLIRSARQRASSAGPNTPALMTVALAAGGTLTLEVGAGTPVAMVVAASAPPRAAAKKQ